MKKTKRHSGFIWHLMRRLNHNIVPRFSKKPHMAGLVLLLTTTGRKSRLPRITPLQFEEVNGLYYVGSARGFEADWYRNILKNPAVQIQIGEQKMTAVAEPITDMHQTADFLELRLQRHPHMVRMILVMHGILGKINRTRLEQLAEKLAMVMITPDIMQPPVNLGI